jgi:histidinol dehydrogenase
MNEYRYPSEEQWSEILKRPVKEQKNLEAIVMEVFKNINENGDNALINYTEKFDNVKITELKVSEKEFNKAEELVSEELKTAIQRAAINIQSFHEAQIPQDEIVETEPGVVCWRKSTAIQKVGLYIPGGTAPLFSTVLMLGIPAKIVDCKEIILCSPPNTKGEIHPAILYTAKLIGIENVYKVGGIQAIGAMSIGTESIPAVYKIFGPGNQFVTAAKQYASLKGVAIDMPAGPSEVLVYSDESGDADFIAADILSQTEHGLDSQAIFVTTSEQLLREVQSAVLEQVEELPRKDIAKHALRNSTAILMSDEESSLKLINQYAPEHLIIMSENEESIVDEITDAGSVFIGNYTPESAGDYASGTNHTLPTNGYAKSYSGVSLDSFIKKITFQKITPEGIKNIGSTIEIMAQEEQLQAHKNAVTLRLNKLK